MINFLFLNIIYSIYFCITGTVVGGPVGGVVATAVTATIIYEKERKFCIFLYVVGFCNIEN